MKAQGIFAFFDRRRWHQAIGGSRRRGKRASWIRSANALTVAREAPAYFNAVRDAGHPAAGVTFIPITRGNR